MTWAPPPAWPADFLGCMGCTHAWGGGVIGSGKNGPMNSGLPGEWLHHAAKYGGPDSPSDSGTRSRNPTTAVPIEPPHQKWPGHPPTAGCELACRRSCSPVPPVAPDTNPGAGLRRRPPCTVFEGCTNQGTGVAQAASTPATYQHTPILPPTHQTRTYTDTLPPPFCLSRFLPQCTKSLHRHAPALRPHTWQNHDKTGRAGRGGRTAQRCPRPGRRRSAPRVPGCAA